MMKWSCRRWARCVLYALLMELRLSAQAVLCRTERDRYASASKMREHPCWCLTWWGRSWLHAMDDSFTSHGTRRAALRAS